MKRTKFNLAVLLIAAVYFIILVIGNVTVSSVGVAAAEGSYAYKFAKSRNLPLVELADSQKGYFDQRYELFDYNVTEGGLCLEAYTGASEDLVIPSEINGAKVVELGEGFFANSPSVQNIYVSDTLKTISAPVDKAITIFCDEDTSIWQDNQGWNIVTEYEAPSSEFGKFEHSVREGNLYINAYTGERNEIVISSRINNKSVVGINESFFNDLTDEVSIYLPKKFCDVEGEPLDNVTFFCSKESPFYENYITWNVESVYDSTYINFDLGDLPFEYNDHGSTLELTSYTGSDKVLVIPSYINGKAVTAVSCDLLGNYDLVVFPETIEEISGQVKAANYSDAFALEVGFTLFAFALALVVVNIILPRLKKLDEIVLNVPQLVLTFFYVLAQFVFSLLVIYKDVASAYTALIISIVLMVLYVVLIFIVSAGRNNAIAVEENIAVKTSWMKTFKRSCADLADGIKDPALKKQVERLVEDIRYSDPVSSEHLEEEENKLQNAVDALREAITAGNPEEIASKCAEAQKALKERNRLSKQVK